ncbi:MAG TPA: phosphonate C-P lyase system protein PhnL [Xanthobacteraceae bacterium]|nr:phosphonate C-P lyase system protein PhnL [Xanthobacteraceae bacterium]
MTPALELRDVAKNFTMHLQGGVRLAVVAGVTFSVRAGECIVLAGPSGAGKSSILKMIFGNYRCEQGKILVQDGMGSFNVAKASPRQMLALRNTTIGYVSQFLRAVPRVPTIDVVAEPLIVNGVPRESAHAKAAALLHRLSIRDALLQLPPATFSGGEQQRVNIARGFLPDLPILLLDEPTASLDADNRAVVQDLIQEKKRRGTAIVAVVHDEQVRDAIADRIVEVAQFAAAA